MTRSNGTRIDKAGVRDARFVFIVWHDAETMVVDDLTGCVVYCTPTVPRALERAVAFARRHRLAVRRVEIPSRVQA